MATAFEGGSYDRVTASTPQGSRWAAKNAPTLADFEEMADAAFKSLPEPFRRQCAGVAIRIEDFADDATLDEMGCVSAFDLLGLFRGRGIAHREATMQTGDMPNMIWLYRRPILEYWASHEDSLQEIVTHVLVHEIGHHFGLSDADMEAIDRAP